MNAMVQTQAKAAVRNAFNGQRRLRPWTNTHFGGLEAAKAHPLAICRFRPDEGGTVSTALDVGLAPVAGYMRSKAYVHVSQIFVPYQAIEKMELDTQEDAGVTEMSRRRLMAGEGIGLEDEGVITKACNIHPKSIGGAKRVTKTARLAYLCAVNHLRKVAYYNATLVTKTETAILPAILTANILDRFNGVLDPERLIDGAINLTGELPVSGIGKTNGTFTEGAVSVRETGGDTENYANSSGVPLGGVNADWRVEEDPANPGYPNIRVNMAGASELTLRDMMESQKLDGLIREFAGMIKKDPINGEEVVARALYGISVDFDHNCHSLYDQIHELSAQHVQPTDGPSVNDVSGHFKLKTRIGTVVPRSELGGQLVTLVMVKPLETLSKQPDPAQTEAWELVNRVHDETELDEQLLKRNDLESDLIAADEDQDAFWVGHNSIKHNYATQGPNAQQTASVEMQSSMWIYEIPTSVTPANVNYPDTIQMYPFWNWNGAHAEYTISQVAAISTSLAKGPNPVERIQLFADDPTLINAE